MLVYPNFIVLIEKIRIESTVLIIVGNILYYFNFILFHHVVTDDKIFKIEIVCYGLIVLKYNVEKTMN